MLMKSDICTEKYSEKSYSEKIAYDINKAKNGDDTLIS